ncbi:MAG TPA: hypothetical protein PK367_00220 [Candidatus Paceibacterota bacterium]|nr:hypothetical protein [Candidatus Paceibacterota bacterium]
MTKKFDSRHNAKIHVFWITIALPLVDENGNTSVLLVPLSVYMDDRSEKPKVIIARDDEKIRRKISKIAGSRSPKIFSSLWATALEAYDSAQAVLDQGWKKITE